MNSLFTSFKYICKVNVFILLICFTYNCTHDNRSFIKKVDQKNIRSSVGKNPIITRIVNGNKYTFLGKNKVKVEDIFKNYIGTFSTNNNYPSPNSLINLEKNENDIPKSFVYVGGGLKGGMQTGNIYIKLLTLKKIPINEQSIEGCNNLEMGILRIKTLKQEIETLVRRINTSSNQTSFIKEINEKIERHNELAELLGRISLEEKNKLENLSRLYNQCINNNNLYRIREGLLQANELLSRKHKEKYLELFKSLESNIEDNKLIKKIKRLGYFGVTINSNNASKACESIKKALSIAEDIINKTTRNKIEKQLKDHLNNISKKFNIDVEEKESNDDLYFGTNTGMVFTIPGTNITHFIPPRLNYSGILNNKFSCESNLFSSIYSNNINSLIFLNSISPTSMPSTTPFSNNNNGNSFDWDFKLFSNHPNTLFFDETLNQIIPEVVDDIYDNYRSPATSPDSIDDEMVLDSSLKNEIFSIDAIISAVLNNLDLILIMIPIGQLVNIPKYIKYCFEVTKAFRTGYYLVSLTSKLPIHQIKNLYFKYKARFFIRKVKKVPKPTRSRICNNNRSRGVGIPKNIIKDTEKFVRSATKPNKNGLTNVGRGLQKHSSRSGSAFSNVKFSHKNADKTGEKVLRDILNSKNKHFEYPKNGCKEIYDKITGRGVSISRNGEFNGFREFKDIHR